MFDRTRYASYANGTKWSELRHAMVGLYPRAPSFGVKTLNWLGEAQWDSEWYYHFKLDNEWKDMEWVDLKAQSSADAISLDDIDAICRRIGFEIEHHGDIIRIIGYRKMASSATSLTAGLPSTPNTTRNALGVRTVARVER